MEKEKFDKACMLSSRIYDLEQALRDFKKHTIGIEKPWSLNRVDIPDDLFKRPCKQIYFLVKGYLQTELKRAKKEFKEL